MPSNLRWDAPGRQVEPVKTSGNSYESGWTGKMPALLELTGKMPVLYWLHAAFILRCGAFRYGSSYIREKRFRLRLAQCGS